VAGIALALLCAARPGAAQEREYRVGGTVVDTAKRPIAGAVVDIRERTSRKAFRIKSEETGAFKLVGLPHGTYEVTVSRDGYQARTDVWDLTEPQGAMKKVEFNPYVLLTDAEVAARARGERARKLFEEAKELVRKGETAAALPALARLLEEQPDDANAHYLVALCRLHDGQPAAAVDSLRRVVELNPGFAPAHTNLGICYEQLGDAEGALAAYDAAIAIDGGNAIALYNAGVLRYNAKDAVRALPYFEKILATAPADDRALEMAGYCELQNGAWARALSYLERARPLIADPGRASAIDEIVKELRSRARPETGEKEEA